MFQYLVVCSVQLHDNNKSNMISTHVFRILKHYNMMRVQARAQALASLLSSLSASSGFIRVHPLRIHPLSVPWPPRVQVQPSSISYMSNLLRSLRTHFLAPACNTSRFPSYRHRLQLCFWILSHSFPSSHQHHMDQIPSWCPSEMLSVQETSPKSAAQMPTSNAASRGFQGMFWWI